MSRRAEDPEDRGADPKPSDPLIEALLERFNEGDVAAREELIRAVATELHSLARREMREQPAGHTLQATAVMNEAYLRLFGRQPVTFHDKAHLLRAAAVAMRCVLADHARAKLRLKRGQNAPRAELDDALASCADDQAASFLEFSDAIEQLARADSVMARAVEMRFLFGLTMNEIADALEMPKRTLEKRFAAAAALIASRLA